MLLALLASICVGVSAACLAILLFELASMIELDKTIDRTEGKRLPFFIRMFLPLASNLGFVTNSEALEGMRKSVGDLINMSGIDEAITPPRFIGVRIIMTFMGVLFLILFTFAEQMLPGLIIVFVFVLYPETWLRGVVRRRHLSILKALPNMLDLLTLSVEAGKDFLTALRDILSRRASDPLGEEFIRALREIQLGKPRTAALREMSLRVRQPDLTSVVDSIIQADELGVSIGQILRVQGDQLRGKRFSRAETLANQAPVKILFPVVVFIFPSVFIILLAPIVAQALKTLS